MSALPPKADMFSVEIDVCFVPKADILRLFDLNRETPVDFVCEKASRCGSPGARYYAHIEQLAYTALQADPLDDVT